MSKNKSDLEDRTKDYPFFHVAKELTTYLVILGFVFSLAGSAKVINAEKERKRLKELSTQQRFEQTLKQRTYDSSGAFTKHFKTNVYKGVKKGYEERKELQEYLDNRIKTLSGRTTIFLPNNIVNNKMYTSAVTVALGEDFQNYNPKLDAKYFVKDCLKYKIDPLVAAGIFFHETRYDTLGVGRMNNPAGIRGKGDAGSRDGFARYSTWQKGVDDFVELLKNYPEYFLKPQGIKNAEIKEIVKIWAPEKDNNDPPTYIKAILNYVKEKNSYVLSIIKSNSKK